MFAPMDCRENSKASQTIQKILEGDNPIDEVAYFDISESMANGGGPACLRLRVVLSQRELSCIKNSVILTDTLYDKLRTIINDYYVDELRIEDFFDQHFLHRTKLALAEIAKALDLGAIYRFQKIG